MEVNDAPERIWINPIIDLPKLNGVMDKNSIVYTRTDAFIEKACEYLHEHLIDYWSQSVTNESKFIDEFIKYMKGELE